MEAAESIRPLPPAYHRLYRRAVEIAQSDHRIRALWLSGSAARGTADPGSDLDLLLAVADDAYKEFVAQAHSWLWSITTALLIKQIPSEKLILTSVNDELCRLDLVAEAVSAVGESPFRTRTVVFDRDGLDALVPAPEPRPGPDRARIAAIAEEFWRVQAIFPVMVDGRGDLLCAQSGLHISTQMLIDLFIESNQPQPLGGLKHFASRLTTQQRAALESIPPYGPDRARLLPAARALTTAMDTVGRASAERSGADYPDALAAAARAALAEVQDR